VLVLLVALHEALLLVLLLRGQVLLRLAHERLQLLLLRVPVARHMAVQLLPRELLPTCTTGTRSACSVTIHARRALPAAGTARTPAAGWP
jgi:hypothetical protein